jgi:CelD/BcsL family acetyltransferase involved in cellulose biosynthesis
VLAGNWQGLAEATHIFADGIWLRCWLDSFARDAEFCVVRAQAGSRVVGLVPLVVDRSRWIRLSVRRLALCANDHSPWGSLLVHPDHRRRTVIELAAFIADLPGWHIFELPRIPSSDRAAAAFLRAMTMHGRASVTRFEQTYVLETCGRWNEYAAGLSRNFRSTLNRTRRQLEARGPLSIVIRQTGEDAERAFEEFLSVDDASWKSSGGEVISKSGRLRNYYGSLISRYMAAGRGWVSVVLSNERPIAAALGFQHGQAAYALKVSSDARVESSTTAPGHLAVLALVEEAFRRDLKQFHFLSGAPSWERYRGTLEPLLSARVFHPGRYGQFVAMIDQVRGASRLITRSGIG